MTNYVSIAECFKRHVFDLISTTPNLLNHVRKRGAQIQLVTSAAQTKPLGMVTWTSPWEVRSTLYQLLHSIVLLQLHTVNYLSHIQKWSVMDAMKKLTNYITPFSSSQEKFVHISAPFISIRHLFLDSMNISLRVQILFNRRCTHN